MNTNNIVTQQLEFSITDPQPAPRPATSASHVTRARWWFTKMRQVVDQAIEWHPAPPAPPQQIWFRETQREIAA